MKTGLALKFRILIVFLIFLLWAGLIVFRLGQLQIVKGEFFRKKATVLTNVVKDVNPLRGEIFLTDSGGNLYPLATNKKKYLLYALPKSIRESDKKGISDKLGFILSESPEDILKKISGDKIYSVIDKSVSEDRAKLILSDESLYGLGLVPNWTRFYPLKEIASHEVGFLGWGTFKQKGQYGLEEYYDSALRGKKGIIKGARDALGRIIPFSQVFYSQGSNGKNLVLTIDYNIEFKCWQVLQELLKKWKAAAGTIIVMDTRSGAVKAMVSQPAFDPNEYSEVKDPALFKNPAIQEAFEPGSSFKPITMAIGLDSGKITPLSSYEDKGFVKVGGRTIWNADMKNWGRVNMTAVLEKSINTGAVFVQSRVSHKTIRDYLIKFGFSARTGIDLSGEAKGSIKNLYSERPINYATASFGQGIAVTPIQLISALSAIANGGRLMRPYVVAKIIDADGKVRENKGEFVRNVVSSKTASELTAMLVSVVDNGFGRTARIPSYYIAAKTGTAQIPKSGGGGYSQQYIHSFIGFAPAFNPLFSILIKIDKPQGVRFAASSLGPAFKELTQYLLNYYQVPPER